MKNPFILFLSIVVLCVFFSCEKKQETTVDVNPSVTTTKDKASNFNNETNDLEGKTIDELRILRNEIFARKGYVFKDAFLNDHFSKQDWYSPNKDAQIELTASEKERIATIKKAEALLKPFDLPEGYELLTSIHRLGDKVDGFPPKVIKQDIDGDQIVDHIQLAKSKIDTSRVLFVSLSTRNDLQKIVITEDEYDMTLPDVEVEDDIIKYGVAYPGSGHFERNVELTYNPKINNLQLTHYTNSSSIMYGGVGKEYDAITGDYTFTEVAATIDDDTMRTTVHKGKQESRMLTPDDINEDLYFYLDMIGIQYKEDFYDDRYCEEQLTEYLVNEFTYGKLSYVDDVYKEALQDFIKAIDVKALMASSDNTYSKSYTLHRDWDLNYIEEDECEDTLYLTIDVDNHIAVIMINNCALVKEDGETIHSSEQSTMFEYSIETHCMYTFKRVTGAG